MHAGGAAEAGTTQQSDSAEPMEEDGAEAASPDDAEQEPGEQPLPKRRRPSLASDPYAAQVACLAAPTVLHCPHQCWHALSACDPAYRAPSLSEKLP